MAVLLKERSTLWRISGGSSPSNYDYRPYIRIYYEQTEADKKLNRTKVITNYYTQYYSDVQRTTYYSTTINHSNYINDKHISWISSKVYISYDEAGLSERTCPAGYSLLYNGQNSTYIYHDSNGKGSFTYKLYEGSTYTYVTGTLSVPTIQTAFAISVSDFDITNNPSIAVGITNNSYTYDLSYSIGELSGIITTGQTITPYVWELEEDLKNQIKELMASTNSMQMTISCNTYNGSTQIGSTKTATCNVLISEKPILNSYAVLETIETIKALTNSAYIIKDLSKLKFTLDGTAPYGTTLKGYKVEIADKIFESSTNEVLTENITNGNTFILKAVDNRTNESEPTNVTIPFIEYVKAEYINTECIVKRTTGNIDTIEVSLKGNFFNSQIGTANNDLTLGYKYKLKGADEYTTGVTGLNISVGNDNTFSASATLEETFDHNKNYEIVFTINDVIHIGSEMIKQVASSQYVMFEHSSGVDFLNATIMGEQIALVSQLSKGIEEFGDGYIRFKKDETLGFGIQICWGTITVASGSTAIGVFGADPGRNITGATFPKEFSEIPKTSGLSARPSTSTYWGIGCQYQANSTTKLGNICIQRRNTTNSTIAGSIDWSAIGKWK